MPADRLYWRGAAVLALVCAALAGTADARARRAPEGDADFGAALRATFAAQVLDPAPRYPSGVAETDADHAAQAADRYRTDKVKLPDRTRTSKLAADKGAGGS